MCFYLFLFCFIFSLSCCFLFNLFNLLLKTSGSVQRSLRMKAMMCSVFGPARLNTFSTTTASSTASTTASTTSDMLLSYIKDDITKVLRGEELQIEEVDTKTEEQLTVTSRVSPSSSTPSPLVNISSSNSSIPSSKSTPAVLPAVLPAVVVPSSSLTLSTTSSNDNNDEISPSSSSKKDSYILKDKYFCAIATDMSTMQFRPYVFRSYQPCKDACLYDG